MVLNHIHGVTRKTDQLYCFPPRKASNLITRVVSWGAEARVQFSPPGLYTESRSTMQREHDVNDSVKHDLGA